MLSTIRLVIDKVKRVYTHHARGKMKPTHRGRDRSLSSRCRRTVGIHIDICI